MRHLPKKTSMVSTLLVEHTCCHVTGHGDRNFHVIRNISHVCCRMNRTMAADAKLLLGTLLRPNTSSLSLLLESVKDSQALQENSAASEWIAKINPLLNSNQDRWMGICLLSCLIKQCSTDLFLEHCASWLKTLARILQQEKENLKVCKLVADTLESILSFSVQFSELSREISSSVIPSLLTAMLNEKDVICEISLLVIKSCIQYYPGATGSFWKRIESHVLEIFSTGDMLLNETACGCFAILPKCGNPAGSGIDKQTASWETQWKKLLSTLSAVIDQLYSNCVTGPSFKVSSPPLDLKPVPVVETQRTETCVFRIKCSLKCLCMMLRNGFPKTVNIPVDLTVKLLQRIVAINGKSLVNQVVIESVLLKSSLPAIHISMLNFLATFIESCQMSLLPYHEKISKMFLLELSWSTSDVKTTGFIQTFGKLRSAVYECLLRWVHITGSTGEHSDTVKKIIHHIISDVKPQVATTKLLTSTSSSSKNTQHGKKAKRKRVQDDVSQLTRTQQKTDHFANVDLCTSGLKALKQIILKTSSHIPPETLKEVQVFVVKLLLECQQASISSSSPHLYPVPYGNAECRKLLYHVLKSLLYYHCTRSPPPVQHAVRIFSQGVQDQDLEVSKFCFEAQMMCHVLIHPRVAIIGSSLSLTSKENTYDEQHHKISEVNLGNEMNVSVTKDVPHTQILSETRVDLAKKKASGSTHSTMNTISGPSAGACSSTTVIEDKCNSHFRNKDILNLSGDVLPDVEESECGETSLPVIVAKETQCKKQGETIENIVEKINENHAKNCGTNSDENANETRDDSLSIKRNHSFSVHQDINLKDGWNGLAVKKQKTEEITFEEARPGDSNTSEMIFRKQPSGKEVSTSDEDEELVKEMIASFVDSLPDSD